jgi:hypothetical protein
LAHHGHDGRIERVSISVGSDQPLPKVRGLALPTLLADLLASGRWQHPGDNVLRDILPWFEDPLDFLSSVKHMERESRSLDRFADDERSSRLFHTTRGGAAAPIWLPWLDADLAFLIAINRHAGDDVAIALDFRPATGSPAVVASDAWTYPGASLWRPVAPSFEAFATMLGITGP